MLRIAKLLCGEPYPWLMEDRVLGDFPSSIALYGSITYISTKGMIMNTSIKKKGDSRIEIRVSNEDKDLFVYASTLKGFKSFSEFIRVTLTEAAKAIIAEEKKILKSKNDKLIFFNALMGEEEKPNQALVSAMKDHTQLSE